MGFISLISSKGLASEAVQRGRSQWRRTFGSSKEDRWREPISKPVPGGSWGRSGIAAPEATMRLIQAMRSRAPGNWSDDRWEETKHQVGIAHAAIAAKCRQFQQAEFQLFRKDRKHPDGKVPISPDDPPHPGFVESPYRAVEVLENPNKHDSFGKMLYRIGQQMNLTGIALNWMVPNKLGTPMELYVIPTAIAIPQPTINPDYPDGYYRIQPIYPYGPFSSYPTPATAVGAPVPAQWIIRSSYPHPLLRYDGYSPLTAMRLEMDSLEAINRSRWYKMKRSSNPDAVLNLTQMEGDSPLPPEEIERIHAEWENEFQGPENAGKLVVGTPGGTFEEFGMKPKDMEYQDGWDQLVGFILGGGFGITKQAAGMIEDSAYATLFATLKQLHILTLKPDLDDIAADFTRHFLPFFGNDLILEIRCPRIDDHELRNGEINIAIQGKCITKNEVRKRLATLDLEPTRDEWGDEFAGEGQEQEQQPGMPEPAGVQEHLSPSEKETAATMPAEAAKPAKSEREASRPVAPEVAKAPTPESLGEGALGPRKHMPVNRIKRIRQSRLLTKSLYDQICAELTNSNGNGF